MARKSPDPSSFSTTTVKPSFFGNSLDAFSKYSVVKQIGNEARLTRVREIDNLSRLSEDNAEPEPNLQNWERWLNIHKQQQEQLSAKLNRPPQCMVMNSNLCGSLYVNQEKRLLTEASNVTICDRYRGHPNFWMTDDNTRNNGKSLGIYQTIQTKYDRSRLNPDSDICSRPTQVEYVGIPDAIYREKGLTGKSCLPTSKDKWEKLSYVANKKECLRENLDIVQTHKPEISDVAIVGTSLSNFAPHLSEPLVENEITESVDPKTSIPFECEFIQFENKIPILVVIDNEKCEGNSKHWIVQFDDCHMNENYEKSVIFQNTGQSSLRYCWEIVFPKWTSNDNIPVRHWKRKSKCFYFNKNDGAIMPGSEMELVFNCKPQAVGIFIETWEILLSHESDEWQSSTLELRAITTERLDSMDTMNVVDTYLESCTSLTVARKTVEEILARNRLLKQQDIPYSWNFFEEQIFVHNNPELFYDSKSVLVLKHLYEALNEGPWDYSVGNLRRKLLRKTSNKNLTEEIDVYTATVYQLMKPNIPYSVLNEKHKSVYELLCCFVNQMESEGTALKFIYTIPTRLKLIQEVSVDYSLSNLSTLSAKPSPKPSMSSRKITRKSSLLKNKFSVERDSVDTHSVGTDLDSKISECEGVEKKQEFLEALFIKTYIHLGRTIDNISAIIDSFDSQKKKTALIALKKRNL
ncbi:hypothetical protein J6590_063342 [Homalodisca vitripennis]|nr:hypothetical protein J6590_063342 [Homalodisca vitripennis]